MNQKHMKRLSHLRETTIFEFKTYYKRDIVKERGS